MLKYSYEYDDLGQLTRENDANKGQTCVYVYDNAGNITLRKVYAYTTAETVTGEPTYTTIYGYTDSSWGDKLTSYDGRAITYDEIGNPLSYYNGVEYTLAWTAGRQLQSASFAGNVVSYTYNDEGIRTSKTVGGIVHEYHLAGSQILSEEWNENGIQHLIVYHYDAAGLPIGMTYRNSGYSYYECDTFIYVKNLQGDIIKVLDVSGNLLVSYTYDAWGSPVSTTYYGTGSSSAARYNPFRYRGYYYDTDTGFYYLNSRYYDSEIGRFINVDGLVSTGQGLLGYNMFAYCNNNPVNRYDPSGMRFHHLDILGGGQNPMSSGGWNGITDSDSAANDSIDPAVKTTRENLKKYGFSFYKGCLVFTADTPFPGSGVSIGVIILDEDNLKAEDAQFSNILNHEYGHFIHLNLIGLENYFSLVAIPSLLSAYLRDHNSNIRKNYYNLPTERIADFLGGVDRGNTPEWANTCGALYWMLTFLYRSPKSVIF